MRIKILIHKILMSQISLEQKYYILDIRFLADFSELQPRVKIVYANKITVHNKSVSFD